MSTAKVTEQELTTRFAEVSGHDDDTGRLDTGRRMDSRKRRQARRREPSQRGNHLLRPA